ncbi:hypothetical protein AB0M39_07845 [Streptomyces sp. NPDC051907]|uniref:hypothetical protein n=1 Tax=Streptomyces sp. NPDC051907 TaxID=3155284 RepID=UPI00342D2133
MSSAPEAALPPSPFATADVYIRAADEAGLLSRIGRLPLVAGEYREPATGELQCLVEHADPELLAHAPRMLDVLFRRFPDCAAAVVRVPAHITPHPVLRPLHTYLRHTAAPPPDDAPACDLVDIDHAADHSHRDQDFVGRWLTRALHDAAVDRGHTPDESGVEDSVHRLLAAPDRRSLLVRVPGRPDPVGHATMLTDAHDDVSDTRFVELVDILVDDSSLRRLATERLVAACARTAAALGLPLVGNVSHPLHDGGADPAAEIVAALRRQRWTPTHVYRHAVRPRP